MLWTQSSNFKGLLQVQVLKCEKEFQQWLETMDSICFWVIVLNSVVENRSNALLARGLFSLLFNGLRIKHAFSFSSSLFLSSFWIKPRFGTKDFVMVKRCSTLQREQQRSKKSPNLPGACKVLVNTFVTLTTALFSLRRISLRFFLSSLSFWKE